MIIRVDNPNNTQITRLLHEHLQDMATLSPPESVHALDVDSLCTADITLWAAWEREDLLGCAALLDLGDGHGEIKSMRTSKQHLRRGIAACLLEHLITQARHRSYTRLSLETGSAPAFAPARKLYIKYGFTFCAPFSDYVTDPHSVFMTRELTTPAAV